MNLELVLIGICGISVVISVVSLGYVMVLKGRVDMLLTAPVLRQYVERFVPVDNSEDAKKAVKEKMVQMEKQFGDSLNVSLGVRANDKAVGNILRADELV